MFTLLWRDTNPAVAVGNETDEDDRVVVAVVDFGDVGVARRHADPADPVQSRRSDFEKSSCLDSSGRTTRSG